jgi:phosphonopyruvate decarboxylase
MVDQSLLFKTLKSLNIGLITGVPDSLLNDFCLYADENLKESEHIIAANEGNAIALAAGHYLATGKVPLVYMQNSGIGNAMNPLLSLTHQTVYSIPMILVIGWRGGESASSDWAQHKRQGELTTVLLDDMNIPYRVIESDDEAIGSFTWAEEKARSIKSPVALIVKKGILAKKEKDAVFPEDKVKLSREEAIDAVLCHLPPDTLYLATTGRATRELNHAKQAHGLPMDTIFLNVGAMGHTSSIALGIAMGQPERQVVCFDGDSAAIMHLGAITTIGKLKPDNFMHILLNNGVHESVGGQESAGQIVNMTGIAKYAGYNTVEAQVITKQELLEVVDNLKKLSGPSFIDIHIRQGIRKDIPPLDISHIEMKENLMNNLSKEADHGE